MTARTPRRAFTLVELIASMTVVAVLASVVSTLALRSADGYAAASIRSSLQHDASIALERIVAALRDIPAKSGAPAGSPDISRIEAGLVEWQTSGSLAIVAGELVLTLDRGSPETIALNAQSLTLAAFDKSEAALSLPRSGGACNAIRVVQVTLTLSRAGESATLRTRVFMRCAEVLP